MDTMTASEQSGATPSSDYSYRPPSPPHIHVAPHREDGDLVLPARDQYYGDEGDNIPHDELRLLTQGNHNAKPNDNWQYETRREAQAILPFLYLGPSSSARDIKALQENGITLLLVIRDKTMAQARMLSGQKVADQLGIEAQAIDVSGNQELIHAFPQAVRVINNHLHSIYRQKHDQQQPTTYQRGAGERRTWGKVLVFCESGNERSACVVAAYIMQMYDCSLVGAIQWVQRQRFCVAFDDGLKTLLSTYQQYLEAKKSVFQDQCQQQIQNNKYLPTHPAKLKRGRDDINADDDMEMTGTGFEVEDDLARFDGRRAFTPFS